MKPTSVKVAGAIALIEIVGLAVVGDKEVEIAVVVKVGPDGGETIAMLGVADAGFL